MQFIVLYMKKEKKKEKKNFILFLSIFPNIENVSSFNVVIRKQFYFVKK